MGSTMSTKVATRRAPVRSSEGATRRTATRGGVAERGADTMRIRTRSGDDALARVLTATANAYSAIPPDARARLLRGSDAEVLATLADTAASSSRSDAFATAKLRGIQVREKLIQAAGGLLDTKGVAEQLGVTPQAIHKQQKEAKLLAVPLGNRLQFPAFQFDESGAPMGGLSAVVRSLAQRSISPWAQLRFLAGHSARLGNRTPIEALRAGELDRVLRAAEAFGEHGAE
jgi:hypothetical protein